MTEEAFQDYHQKFMEVLSSAKSRLDDIEEVSDNDKSERMVNKFKAYKKVVKEVKRALDENTLRLGAKLSSEDTGFLDLYMGFQRAPPAPTQLPQTDLDQTGLVNPASGESSSNSIYYDSDRETQLPHGQVLSQGIEERLRSRMNNSKD